MSWNFHRYYSDSTDGLISKLKLADERIATLKRLRKQVRIRTKVVFEEAKQLAKASNPASSFESMKLQVENSRLKHLSPLNRPQFPRHLTALK
ncbi:hypothetical protein [Aeromonas veronii]|uniref:hypothetical protein n=1 Tax=Aeromonas veronii TaxID=654 RepID=UPI003F7A9387